MGNILVSRVGLETGRQSWGGTALAAPGERSWTAAITAREYRHASPALVSHSGHSTDRMYACPSVTVSPNRSTPA